MPEMKREERPQYQLVVHSQNPQVPGVGTASTLVQIEYLEALKTGYVSPRLQIPGHTESSSPILQDLHPLPLPFRAPDQHHLPLLR